MIFCKFLAFIIFILSGYNNLLAQEDTSIITIAFVGDIMGHDGQIKAAYNNELQTYNYDSVFSFVSSYIKKADLAVANLEVTLGGPPYKGYPQFSSPDELAVALKNTGFDILCTANNHCLDRGGKGLIRTIKVLDSLSLIHTGTFLSQTYRDSVYPLIINVKNFTLAFLNYTYGTNGIVVKPPLIVNYIDTSIIAKDIDKAKQFNPDFIICILHWGNEYQNSFNDEQKLLAEFLFKKGIKIIIGSHPHVLQPVLVYYNDNNDKKVIEKLVVYSLGNFVSNQRMRYRDGGIIFNLKLMKTSDKSFISDCSYIPVWVYAGIINNDYEFRVIPYKIYKEKPDIVPLNQDDKQKIEQFYRDTKEILNNLKEER